MEGVERAKKRLSREERFTSRLEEHARELAERTAERIGNPADRARLEREIALTLSHLDETSGIERIRRRRLSEEHFYTYRELVREKRSVQYLPLRPNSVDWLKSRLGEIEKQLWGVEENRLRTRERLLERLLVLVEEHAQLM